MDSLEHSINIKNIMLQGYYQDKNGRWVHRGKYGLPKQIIDIKINEYLNRVNKCL